MLCHNEALYCWRNPLHMGSSSKDGRMNQTLTRLPIPRLLVRVLINQSRRTAPANAARKVQSIPSVAIC